jgi:hypothetical protein
MANKAKKPRAKRSIRSGKKTAKLINNNQEIIYNVWTTLNSQQVLKNF